MSQLDIARDYLSRMQAHDGSGAAALFSAQGVLDDGNGAHHSGRAAITAFIDSLTSNVVVTESSAVVTPGRVTIFGYVGSELLERSMFRWVFHFDGIEITHLGNSFLRSMPTLE